MTDSQFAHDFIDKVLLISGIFIAAIGLIYYLFSTHHWFLILNASAATIFMLLFFFRKHISENMKITLMLLFAAVLAIHSFYAGAFLRDGTIVLAAMIVLASSTWSSQKTLIVPVLGILGMGVFAALVSLGILEYNEALGAELNKTSAWLIRILVMILFTYITIGSISSFQRRLKIHIYQLQKSKQELENIAFYDKLTGLMNRQQFEQSVNQRIKNLKDKQCSGTLILIDLKGFRLFNSLYGHRLGDLLLQKMGEILGAYQHATNFIARLSGDEFAGWIENCSSDRVKEILERFSYDLLRGTNFGQKIEFYSSFVHVPAPDADFSKLISMAGLAMRIAKQNDSLTPIEFNPEMGTMIRQEQDLNNIVKTAVVTDAFSVVYQKKVDINTSETVSLEALARLSLPGQSISPEIFIPVIQKANLMAEFTRLIFRKVLQDLPAIEKTLGAHVSVSINISPVFFLASEFVPFVQQELDINNIDPAILIFEITEDLYIQDTELANYVIAQIRAIGIKLSLDDFGKGYSSLSYLQSMTIDELKIDRSFLENIDKDERSFKVFQSICSIASSLGYKIVAEGVETIEQLACVKKTSCDIVQGFYFARPLPADEL